MQIDEESRVYIYYQAGRRVVAGPISFVCVRVLDADRLARKKGELLREVRKQLKRDLTKAPFTSYENCIEQIEELVTDQIIDIKDRVVLPSLLGGRDPESYLDSIKEGLVAQAALSFSKSKPLQTVVRCMNIIKPTPYWNNCLECHSFGSLLTKIISEYRRLYLIEKVFRHSYPEYSLEVCKGILTTDHTLAILKHGLKPIHIPTRLKNLTKIWFKQLKDLNNDFLDLPYDLANLPSWWEDYFLQSDFGKVAVDDGRSDLITGDYPAEFLDWLASTEEKNSD